MKKLSKEEVIKMVLEAQAGSEEAMAKVMKQFESFVWHCVRKVGKSHHVDKEDYFQIGNIGLMQAVKRFDPSFNLGFTTFALPTVIGNMRRFNRDFKTVRVTRSIHELAAKILKNELMEKEPEEISKILQVTNIDLIKETLQYVNQQTVLSTDMTIGEDDDGGVTFGEKIADDVNGENWFESMLVRDAIDKLDERKAQLIRLYYFEDKSQKEIGDQLGISQMHVSRLTKKAIKELKEHLIPKEGIVVEKQLAYEAAQRGEQVAASTEKKQRGANKPEGDREEAIKLLQSTAMSSAKISRATGVSAPVVTALSKKYRSPELRAAIKKRGNSKAPTPSLTELLAEIGQTTVDAREAAVALEAEKVANVPDKVVTPVTEAPTAKSEGKVVSAEVKNEKSTRGVTVSFSFQLDVTGAEVEKAEAVENLRKAIDLLDKVDTDTVNLDVRVNN